MSQGTPPDAEKDSSVENSSVEDSTVDGGRWSADFGEEVCVEACAAFLSIAHAAFPLAALGPARAGLLGHRLPLANRSFTLSDPATSSAFLAARSAFCKATLSCKWPPQPPPGSSTPCIDPGGACLSQDYAAVEMDCLLKVPALSDCTWTRDPAAQAGPFLLAPSAITALPLRSGPALALQGGGGQAHQLALPPGPLALAQRGGRHTSSRFTLDHYPAHAAMYILGEVYAPLGREDARAKPLAQQLLHAERNLRFLEAKEGRAVAECVLGVVFLGPQLSEEQGGLLRQALQHYRSILPCLWGLCTAGRVLGCKVHIFHPVVLAALTDWAIERIEQRVQQQEQQRLQQLQQLQVVLQQRALEQQELRRLQGQVQVLQARLLLSSCCAVA